LLVSNQKEKERLSVFNIFWKHYPKKVQKDKCKKKFLTLTDSEINQIKKTLKDFLENKPFEDYTHPNPMTYLNQKRWEDVIEVKPKQVTQQAGNPTTW